MYARDLAVRLLQFGHTPILYSTQLGDIAREIRAKTVSVTDNLNSVSTPPDIIHGHHALETATALLHFPQTPAIQTIHGNLGFLSSPPKFTRIRRYLPVDNTCRDRLINEFGLEEERVRVILNSFDLNRFAQRAALPPRPRRALIFSNLTDLHFKAVQAACEQTRIELDVIGADTNICSNPEEVLPQYDLVFAKARCALEALAVGAAVILCDYHGLGPMVTTGELDRLRALNFGHRTLCNELSADLIINEINRYDAIDAAKVSRRIRSTASLDSMVYELVAIYQEALAEYKQTDGIDAESESRETAEFLRWLSIQTHSNPSGRAALKTVLSRIPILNSPEVTERILRVASKVSAARNR